MSIGKRRSIAIASGVALAGAVGAVALTTASAGTANAAAGNCGYLFDDFNYNSSADATLTGHGWVPRTYPGGPGVPGATWSANSISFPTSAGQKVMQLTASTDGTGGGTNQAELYTSQKRYFEGTYASRIRFTDTPQSGSDGDHVNETFFTISPLNGDLDPTYSELDFSEYLPNGGWGETGPINYQTTWYTYRADPWYADNVHSEERRSFDGWHDLVIQVSGGHVISSVFSFCWTSASTVALSSSTSWQRSNVSRCTSILPASIFEMSSTSLIRPSSSRALRWTRSRLSRCCAVSSPCVPRSSVPVNPRMTVIGVRSSCETAARKRSFSSEARWSSCAVFAIRLRCSSRSSFCSARRRDCSATRSFAVALARATARLGAMAASVLRACGVNGATAPSARTPTASPKYISGRCTLSRGRIRPSNRSTVGVCASTET